MVDGKLEEAIAELHKLTNSAPDFDGARSALASALLAAGKREQALAEISQLSHDRPDDKDLRAAAEVLRKTSTLPADGEDALMGTAATQMLLMQPAMSRLALEKAAAQNPKSTRILASRTQLELRSGNAAEALRLAQQLAAAQPDDFIALSLLARAQDANGQRDQSIATLEKLVAKHPNAQTVAELHNLLKEQAPDKSFAPLQAWLAQHADDRAMRATLADSLRTAGHNREAIAEYEKLLATAPNDPFVLNNLAWLYYLEKDPRALATARTAAQKAPKHPSVADTYGWLLVESGDTAQGLEVLQALAQSGLMIDPDARYHYAAALARAGKKEEARQQLGALLMETARFASRAEAEALAATLKA
jgi:Flp pilus assembly protein TadD